MESPPSGSTWLEAFPASDDSGLLLTSGSISSSSGEGCHCTLAMELQDSDDDGKSLSREGSLDYSDGMSCENFNTLKKGPGWPEFYSFENSCDGKLVPIDPPPEFQDSPPLSEVYQTVPAKNILVGPCRPLSAKSISRVSPASERRYIDKFSGKLVASILAEALSISCKVTWSIHCSQDCHPLECELGKFSQQSASSPRLCWTPELPLVPRTCPGSRASPASPLSRGRPSPPPHQPRRSDSTPGEIGDVYNVPFDSDVYAVPVDVVRPTADATTTTSSRKASSSTQQTLQQPQRPGRRHLRKRRRHPSAAGSRSEATTGTTRGRGSTATLGQPQQQQSVATGTDSGGKRHSVPQSTTSPDPPAPANGASSGLAGRCCPTAGSSRTSARTKGGHRGASNEGRSSEPIHMTLQEVRQYLRNLYSGGGCGRVRGRGGENEGEAEDGGGGGKGGRHKGGGTAAAPQSATIVSNGKAAMLGAEGSSRETSGRSSSSSRHGGFSTNLRQTLCSIFRLRRVPASPGGGRRHATTARRPIPTPPESAVSSSALEDQVEQQQPSSEVPPPPFTGRALPPLPPSTRPPAPLPDETSPLSPPPMEEGDKGEDGAAGDQSVTEEPSMDFASSIEKVKDYGWYWGPISGEAAEKILFNEPDGSFIVRDSSDDHYIFSLTFKLNGCVRHVRIEHDQGNFSFGCCTKFKSHTIVDFIENAVEHSRSGRYLFFLHRRPVLGPMRVQLLHPVSRFKQVQSLQHMCRFVILKVVRRDLIQTLPLPRRIIDYLSTPHYYSEQTLEEERSGSSGAGSPGGGTRGGGGSLQQTPPPPPPLSRPPEILPEDDTPPS